MGCSKTATDAFGNVYNVQVEESERLKRLQRKSCRQLVAAGWDPKKGKQKKVKRSNNWYKTQRLIHKEYARLDNRKDAAAIQMTNEVLSENEVLVIQDENLTGWQSNGHGKKVQHGILGRVKERLVSSPQVRVINRWVPTTKLCTNCGKTYDDITQRERRFVCPHCGHDDGERDCHSAKDMVWLYLNMRDKIGLDGTEFKREDFDEGL
jgi:putative transposase